MTQLRTKISKFTKFIATAICITAVSSFAQAEPLKSTNIEINDTVIRLGDIFNVGQLQATEELFQAPPLGRKGVITASMLQSIAKQYNIDWENLQKITKVTISRKSKTINSGIIKNLVKQYALNQGYVNNFEEQVTIRLYDKFKSIVIAANEFTNLSISEFDYSPTSDQFTGKVRYTQNGRTKSLDLSGKIENLVSIPVLANNIRRNQTIMYSDIKFIKINNRRLAENILINSDDIVGKAAKNNIRAMQPISEHLLKYPDLVKKNSIINLTFTSGRIQLNIKARALTTGAKGALIRVMNLKSNKQIDAIVTGKDRAMTLNSNTKNAKQIASSN